MKRWMGAGLVCLAMSVCAETALWPSPETKMVAQSDSRITPLPDGAMAVRTGTRASWPGMKMVFLAGERDLSSFSAIAIAVSNTTDRTRTVHLSIKCRALQGGSPGGSVTLAPHAAGIIRANLKTMPWLLDAPLPLEGMNGYPTSLNTVKTGAFNIQKVTEFHIFYNQDGIESGFAVSAVTADSVQTAQKVLSTQNFLPFVDRFGQFKHDDWPGKIHSDGELARSRETEAAWLAQNAQSPIPDADRFGGWAKGPQLKATGSFRAEKVNGKWWLVDPDGHLFFSHGIDCIRSDNGNTGVTFRERYFEWLPSEKEEPFGRYYWTQKWPAAHGFYKDPNHLPFKLFDFGRANQYRKYGPDWEQQFAERAHRRLHAWGVNTIANWSSSSVYRLCKTPYTATFGTSGPVIEGSEGWWGKLRDPFAPAFIENVKKAARNEAAKSGDDPWCIGYFVDNELSWGRDNRELARAVLRSPATQPAKRVFKDWLAKRFGEIAKLNAKWGSDFTDWDAFLAATAVPEEGKCKEELEGFHREVVAQYFRTVRDAIRSAAPNRLYLGTRIAWGSNVIYEESARYCDVVSVNIYDRRPSSDLPPEAEDKPMINGEFHFGALDRGMFHTGLVPTQSQAERAQCYKNFVLGCLRHPRFVGTHWFQWQDQALTGRTDGENYQIGFLTVTDTPYPELVEAAREIAGKMYTVRYGEGE